MTAHAAAGWVDAKTIRLRGVDVTLSEPVLVGRSKGYFWFPTMARLSSGDLVAGMSTEPDGSTDKPTSRRLWSCDGGLSWAHPQFVGHPYLPDCHPLAERGVGFATANLARGGQVRPTYKSTVLRS
jgi:hypothetical protein